MTDHIDEANEVSLSKRQFLQYGATLGLVPLASLLGADSAAQTVLPPRYLDPVTFNQFVERMPLCEVATQSVEGPYYLDKELVRRDIRDGQVGELVTYRLEITNANRLCAPVAGALVSIWQCNALGEYSGYAGSKWNELVRIEDTDASGHVPVKSPERFLRGAQRSDAKGVVEFSSIIPGWYAPRAAHLHVRVFLSERIAATTQLYFPQSLINQVYAKQPYVQHGPGPYTNENDMVRRQTHAGLTTIMAMSRDDQGGLVASAKLGLSHV